ncbi:MAG: class I adenylate-forming enzyme family protein [Marmoricola sp.]
MDVAAQSADAPYGIAGLLRTAARAEPHRTALSEAATGRTVTWAVLDDLADRVARGLSEAGVPAGFRVALVLTNRIELVALYLGVLRAGLVAVPVNPRSVTGELVRLLADSGARMVVADPDSVAVVRTAVTGLSEALAQRPDHDPGPRLVVVGVPAEPGELTWDDLVREEPRPVPVREDAEAAAVLLYTSGTSGQPRAAMLSQRALLANIEQVAAVEPRMIVGQDVVLGVLPLFHVYGLNAVLGQVLRQHARLVLVDGFDAEGSLDLIEDEAVSVVPVAPTAVAHWMQVPGLEERLGPVRLVLSGSAPIADDLAAAFEERTGLVVHQGYGLTEAAPVVTSTLCADGARAVGSVGIPLPGIEIRVVDDGGRAPEPGDAGEIWLRGDNLFSGYWPDGDDGPDPEGWFGTGDVGFVGGDGQLVLVDRLKDLVIVSGFNVYPSEVEEVVAELTEVAAVGVVGAADERTGEAVVAYVVPAPGADVDRLADIVAEHCSRRLARFKRPSVVHVVEALPRTSTGKVRKGLLRATERRRALGLLE